MKVPKGPHTLMDLLLGPTCGPTILGPLCGPISVGPLCGPNIVGPQVGPTKRSMVADSVCVWQRIYARRWEKRKCFNLNIFKTLAGSVQKTFTGKVQHHEKIPPLPLQQYENVFMYVLLSEIYSYKKSRYLLFSVLYACEFDNECECVCV